MSTARADLGVDGAVVALRRVGVGGLGVELDRLGPILDDGRHWGWGGGWGGVGGDFLVGPIARAVA